MTLEEAGNSVGTLAATLSAGNLSYNNLGALNINQITADVTSTLHFVGQGSITLGTVTGVTTVGGSIDIQTHGGGANLTSVVTNGNISSNGGTGVSGGEILLISSGNIDLAGNVTGVGDGAGKTAGKITVQAAGTVKVSALTSTGTNTAASNLVQIKAGTTIDQYAGTAIT